MELLEAPTKTLNDGDVAMMIMATTFVMLQTPAMGIAQAGLIRRKNALSMLMQTLFGMVLGSVLWYVIGFSLVFGDTAGGFIGNPGGSIGPFFKGVFLDKPLTTAAGAADTIPGVLMAAFQMMFALMVPIITTGAWAEKMSFDAFVIFVTTWPFLVYYVLAHWIWNEGGWLAAWGVRDFAGGITIHTATGVAALAVVLNLQARKHHTAIIQQHHNMPLSTLGAAMIWGGWYSFNGGSAYKANFQAAGALLNTHISACTGGFTWTILSRYETGKWQLSSVVNGAFAGLAAITAGSGFMPSQVAFCVGICAATAGYFTVKLRIHLLLDDVCECMALQGVPGIVGSLAVGFGAHADHVPCDYVKSIAANKTCCSPTGAGCGTNGLLFGGGFTLLGKQTTAVSVSAAWTFVMTFGIMKLIDRTVGVDISPECEEKGLDEVQIGEMAYDHDIAGSGNIHRHHAENPCEYAEKLCAAAADGSLVKVHRLLLSNGADATAVDYDLRSPAHLAAAHGHLRILQELQRFGCEMDAHDRFQNTPMMEAIVNGHDNIVSWLADQGFVAEPEVLLEHLLGGCGEGDMDHVRRLITAGADVNGHDYDERTPLHVAASEGRDEIIALLLEHGADVMKKDRWGNIPFDDAVREHHKECQELLRDISGRGFKPPMATANGSLEMGAALGDHNNNNNTNQRGGPLSKAEARLAKLMRARRANGADTGNKNDNNSDNKTAGNSDDPGERQQKHSASSNNNHDNHAHRTRRHAASLTGGSLYGGSQENEDKNSKKAGLLTIETGSKVGAAGGGGGGGVSREGGSLGGSPDNAGGRELCAAASAGNLKEVKRLLKKGASPTQGDYDGRTALHLAACAGHVDCLSAMFESNPNLDVNVTDRWHQTPLADALKSDMPETSALLRHAGGVVMESKRGHALCAAAAKGDLAALKQMRERFQADLAVADYDGRTALHLAACEGHINVVSWLLVEGGLKDDPNPTDRFGNTPLADSIRHKHHGITKLLRMVGGEATRRSIAASHLTPQALEEHKQKVLLNASMTSSVAGPAVAAAFASVAAGGGGGGKKNNTTNGSSLRPPQLLKPTPHHYDEKEITSPTIAVTHPEGVEAWAATAAAATAVLNPDIDDPADIQIVTSDGHLGHGDDDDDDDGDPHHHRHHGSDDDGDDGVQWNAENFQAFDPEE